MSEGEYYIEYLKKTDRFPRSLYHKAKHKMVKVIFEDILPGSLVLDAACGVGNITGKYCERYSIVGIDEQLSAIEHCRKTCSGKYVQSSLYRIPFSDNTFDCVLFLDAIEHFQDPEAALQELWRVLKPGAKILICTMNYDNPLWFVLEHTWHRFFGGTCKPYSKDVHPTPYNAKLLRKHCQSLFKEIILKKRIMGMELFFVGQKIDTPSDR